MKFRYHLLLIAILCLGFCMYGLYEKRSYSDVTKNPGEIAQFQVAEMTSRLALRDAAGLKESLPDTPYIVRVKPMEAVQYFFLGGWQKVRIEEVYQGELHEGDVIYIMSERWQVYPQDRARDMAFVNSMQEGEEYLVFLSEWIENDRRTKIPVYRLKKGEGIGAVFHYADHQNRIYPINEDSTFVPYQEVAQNEFFAESEEGLEAFLDLKKEMISRFKKSS